MAYFSSKDHCDQILDSLQNRSCYKVSLVGDEGVGSLSDSLWLFSPLVRSIIDSLNSINDNIIILPDFSHDHIKTGLDIIEGNDSEVLLFNSTVKEFLELLGIDLKHVKPVENFDGGENVIVDFGSLIPTETVDRKDDDELPDIPDDDDEEDTSNEDESQNLMEEEESEPVAVPTQHIKAEKEEDIQYQLLLDQDLSIDEAKADREKDTIKNNNDSKQQKLQELENIMIDANGTWKCKVCSKAFPTKTRLRTHAENHVSGLSYPCGICNEIYTTKSRL